MATLVSDYPDEKRRRLTGEETQMARRSMDSILSDQPTVHDLPESSDSAPEVQDKAEKAEPVAKPDPETEKAPIEAKATKDTKEGDEEEDHVPDDLAGLKRALAAARGDKRKARKEWREAEKKLAEFQGRMSAIEKMQQPTKEQQPAPNDLTEEEFFGKGPEAIKAYVARQLAAVRDEQRTQRLNYSEAAARERHEDFQDAFENFKRFASTQPHLWQQMDASHDPGEFVYRTGKTFQELQGVSNLDELKKKIRAEVVAELGSEKSAQPAPQAPPKSIAGARGTGVAAASPWTGPRPLEDLFR